MALGEVPSPAVYTVEVPSADGAAIGSWCTAFSAAVTCSFSPAAHLDLSPDVDVYGVLFAEIGRSHFTSINITIDP